MISVLILLVSSTLVASLQDVEDSFAEFINPDIVCPIPYGRDCPAIGLDYKRTCRCRPFDDQPVNPDHVLECPAGYRAGFCQAIDPSSTPIIEEDTFAEILNPDLVCPKGYWRECPAIGLDYKRTCRCRSFDDQPINPKNALECPARYYDAFCHPVKR